jgi:hypothetical protein
MHEGGFTSMSPAQQLDDIAAIFRERGWAALSFRRLPPGRTVPAGAHVGGQRRGTAQVNTATGYLRDAPPEGSLSLLIVIAASPPGAARTEQ